MDYELMENLQKLLNKFADEHMRTMLGINEYYNFLRARDKLYHIMWETLDDEM